MFTAEQLDCINGSYFNVIVTDENDVTIQSKNTGHYWYIHSTGVKGDRACIIFHKHKFEQPYHQHGYGNSIRQVIRHIQSHDIWQLNGRGRKK